jgi:hypothetical protein
MLGLFLLFLLAFIFFPLITHFYFSLLENDLRWIATSKNRAASENIVRLATFELREIPLYHSPYDIHPFSHAVLCAEVPPCVDLGEPRSQSSHLMSYAETPKGLLDGGLTQPARRSNGFRVG